MQNKPRYSRISDILDLIIYMLSKFNGVTLKDIQDRFNVSRRTAERMRDAVLSVLPQVDEIETFDKYKRWGFTNYSINELISFSDKNIAFLENLKNNANNITKMEIDNILTKIKALKIKNKEYDENNISLIMQSEGYAIKQTPNYKIDLVTISNIRQAIKNKRKLKCEYHNKIRIIEPLGVIYGEKIHLLAMEKEKGKDIYNFILHKIKNTEILNDTFDSNNFNLKEYAQKSFGTYWGKEYDVKLKFIPEVAEDVLNYKFHPSQKIKQKADGSIIVTFKASGEQHIIWNIFKWGNSVKIIAPTSLKNYYKQYINKIINNM